MGSQVLVLVGTLAGASLTFLFSLLTARRSRENAIEDRTRAERLEAATALPTAVVTYRHAQIARQMHFVTSNNRDSALSNEVREARAAAWSALYRLDLVTGDPDLRAAALALMRRIKEVKSLNDPAAIDRTGERIHREIRAFVGLARDRLGLA